MAQIRLTKRGRALADRGKSKRRASTLQNDVFKMYTLKDTGEKILVNESEIFRKRDSAK